MGTLGGVGLLGAVLGWLAKTLLDHVLIKDRSRERRRFEEFNEAAKDLRRAFSEEIALLRSSAPCYRAETYNTLKKAFPHHERAVFEFYESLDKYKKSDFISAWKNYYYPEELNSIFPEQEVKIHILAQYLSVNDEEEAEYKAVALDRIQAVLAFAKLNSVVR